MSSDINMTPDILLEKIDSLRICTNNGDRSPHKPLLLLLALGRISNGKPRLMLFEDIVGELVNLLALYGPSTAKNNPIDPFWRLSNDGIWDNPELSLLSMSKGSYSQGFLKDNKVTGGFTEQVYELLQSDPDLVEKIASKLLSTHFKPSQWESIRDDISLDTEPQSYYYIQKLARRDRKFRMRVLSAYDYKCAICGFNLQIHDKHLALEAAHIKWFEAKGPDTEDNGLALCSTHHKLLDSGVLGITNTQKLIVTDMIRSNDDCHETVLALHEKTLLLPVNQDFHPNPEYTNWQLKQVFKGRF